MKKGLAILAAVSVFVAASLGFLLFSASGLNLVLKAVSQVTDGMFTVETSGGSIAGGWQISGLKIRSAGADVSVTELSMAWQLSTLLEGNVHATAISIKDVEIIVKEQETKVQEQASSPFTLPLIALPLTIIVDRLTVDGALVRHVDKSEPLFVMNRLSLRIQAGADKLTVEELSVKSPEFDTTLNGKLRFSKNWPLEFQGKWMVEPADYPHVSGTMRLLGTVASPEFIISVSDPLVVNLSGTLTDIFDNLSWQVRAEAESLNPQTISPEWPLLDAEATFESAGTIDDYDGRIRAEIETDEYAPASVDLSFSGNQSNLSIDPVTAAIGSSETTVTALLDWQNGFSWQVNGKTESLNPQNISPAWPRLDAEATFESAGTIDDYDGRIRAEIETDEYAPASVDLSFSGNQSNLSIDPVTAAIGSSETTVTALLDWQNGFSWQVNGKTESLNPQKISPAWPLLDAEATYESAGTIDDYSGEIRALVEVDEYAPASVELSFSGTQSNLSVKPVTAVIGSSETTVTALFDWQNDFSWQVNGKTESLNPQKISPAWPLLEAEATYESAGTIDDYRGRLRALIEVDENIQPAVDLSFSGNQSNLSVEPAAITLGNSETAVTALVDWQNDLKWRLQTDVNDLDLSAFAPRLAGLVSLSAETDGTYGKNLQYSLQVSNFVGAFDALNQQVLGGLILDGNESGLELVSSDFAVGVGHVDLTGMVNWQDAVSWDMRVLITSFDPAVIEATVKGSVNAEIKSHGSASENSINGGVELKNVSGLLAGYELSGGGVIDYQDGNIKITNLFFENGKNHLEIDGRIEQSLDLVFSLEGPELTRIVPALKGMVNAQGSVSGSKEFPELSAKIEGDTLSYGDYSMGKISSDINVSTKLDSEIKTSIQAGDIQIAGYHVEQAVVELTGTAEKHHLEVRIDSDHGALQLSTDGMLSELKIWEAEIRKLRFEHPQFGVWQDNGTGSLRLSAESADVRDLCIFSERIEFCSEGSWQSPARWSFDTSQIKVDLAFLNDWSIMEPEVKGVVHGALSGSGDRARLSSLSAEFTLDEMMAGLEKNDYYQEMKWFDTAVTVKLDNTLLKTELYSRFIDDSFIKGTLGIRGVDDLSGQLKDLPLEGNLQTVLNDVSPLKIVTGGYLEPSGRLNADLTLSGSIGDPRVSGGIDLADGEIHIPQLNITPKHITASVKGQDDSLLVELEAVSGEGTVSADGEFSFTDDSWLGTLKIVGKNVELMQQKDIEITADSDLLLTLGPDGGRLEGTIVVPKALIQPEEMTGSVSESDDVVMMGEEGDAGSWPFNLAVRIELGDDVKVNGYGLSGNLKGSLDLANSRNAFLAGQGELYLADGLFSLYERELEITRGRILFGGGPVDNPGLDVSAKKIIKAKEFGEDDITVGVNIIGSVDDFEMDLFSIPTMDDADIIAYIIVGTSMSSAGDSESGAVGAALNAITQNRGNKILGDIGGAFAVDDLKIEGSGSDDTSLVVGKQLFDDLYLSYDFNLYKNAGYLKIRYDFGKGFSVESKNSMESNGLNLLYSFER